MLRKLLLLLLLATASRAGAGEVTRVSRWELHSSFWMNLHQALMHDATARNPRDLKLLDDDERAAWLAAVAAYRTAATGSGNITFAKPMVIAQDELTQVADDAVSVPVAGAIGDALRGAAPVYRKHRWPSEDRANRFFIACAVAMLRERGDELARQHERVYGEPLPASIRVDIAADAGPFGAYSLPLQDGGFVTTMSCREPGYQGYAALEMFLHEASHAVVGPRNGRVARAIADAAAKRSVEVPRDLWHALLFGTSGELARRDLSRLGITYTPATQDMYTRVWPQYRAAIETYWYPCLDGNGSLDDAIAKIVAEVAKAPAR